MLGEPCEIAVRYINVVGSVRPFRERERGRVSEGGREGGRPKELGSLAGTEGREEGRNGSPK